MINVFMVALSTFPYNKLDKESGKYILTESQYQYCNGDKEEIQVKGIYQLDAVPALLKKQDVPIDHVILLSTSATKREKNITIEGTSYEETISPEGYFSNYLKKLNVIRELADDSIIPLELNEDQPSKAISDASRYLTKWSENDDVHLYVDTHGGFRGTQLVVEAIISLLTKGNIITSFYGVKFAGKKGNKIIEDTTTKIFDFVSGINEFLNYGRIDSLMNYLNEDVDKDMVNAIQEISEGIQWCNLNSFDKGIKDLKRFNKKDSKNKVQNEDPYLALFKERIKQDFDSLLKKSYDAVDIVKWCMRKGFYQQVLTIIESRMPTALIKRNIIEVTDNGKVFQQKYHVNVGMDSLTDADLFNGCLYRFKPDVTWWKVNEKYLFNDTFDSGNCFEDITLIIGRDVLKINVGSTAAYQRLLNTAATCQVNARNVGVKKEENAISFSTGGKEKYLTTLFLMHVTMKDIRNKANHIMKDNPYDQKAVKNAIDYYLWLIEKLQQE